MYKTVTVGSLFSGIGVMDYGLHLAGLEHRWFCESDKFRSEILQLRWPDVVIHPDITTLDTSTLEEVDVIAGGFPPGGFSSLRDRSKDTPNPGISLWGEMLRVVGDLRPRWVLLESLQTTIGYAGGEFFGSILRDLAALGYDVEWDCLPAHAFGAPHKRDRLFLTAYLHGSRTRRQEADDEFRAWTENLPVQYPGPPSPLGSGQWDFGEYGPAFARWEAVQGGPVPEPLVRRVAVRSAARLEQQRVSAVCDGILVQAAQFCGARILAAESVLRRA